MLVAVCISTWRRPVALAYLLDSLTRLTFVKQPTPELILIVVDNDVDRSAEAVVEEFRGRMPWPTVYSVEARRNIAHARNAAVREACTRSAEALVFIDDDETACPEWLDELLDTQRRFQADVVNGPVRPTYAEGVPDWVKDGRFFEPPVFETGAEIKMAATNNVLVLARLFQGLEEPFNPDFGMSGGSDSHFFLRVAMAGSRMVWSNKAMVEEFVPLERATATWIVQRSFRMGNGGVFCERSLIDWPRWLPMRVFKASGRLGISGALLLPAVFRGRAPTVRMLQKVAHSLGSLVGVAGVRYKEYQYFMITGRSDTPVLPPPPPVGTPGERAGTTDDAGRTH